MATRGPRRFSYSSRRFSRVVESPLESRLDERSFLRAGDAVARRNFAEPFLSISLPLPPSPARETRRKRELRRLARGTFNTQHGVRQKHGSWRVVAEPALSSPRATFDRGLSIATGGRRRSWAGKRRIKRSKTFKQRLVVRYQRP